MKFSGILFCVATCFVGTAQAEGGCPAGQYPIGGQGAMACAPMPQQQQRQAPRRPTGVWIKTWGSIAMGTTDSITTYGVPTGKSSAAEAEADALRRCGSRGETNCRVMITYQDQCVVIVEPHINGKPFSTGIVKFVSTGSIAKASELGKSDCQQENSATPEAQCVVVHAACSYPVFREY